ncbi:TLC domain-containing protein 4-B-like [Branchiostoma lanceolatum]|uniref:TLC domain-containing protein 4-B-like n=1 Tax=Branchiostoma lanceolatum TaxID=7740 RepID=UPI003452224A
MSICHAAIIGGRALYMFLFVYGATPLEDLWFQTPFYVNAACFSLAHMAADSLLMTIYVPLRDWKMILHHAIVVWGCNNAIAGPTVQYVGNTLFLTELSTPFVNMRLILHTLGHRRSLLYKVNGVAMLVVFFLCRIATIPNFFEVIPHMTTGEIYKIRSGALINIFVLSPVLCAMNVFWFIKMCKGAYRVLYFPHTT